MRPVEPELRRANPFSKSLLPRAWQCLLVTSLPSTMQTPPERHRTLPRRPAASTPVRDPTFVLGTRLSVDRRKRIGTPEPPRENDRKTLRPRSIPPRHIPVEFPGPPTPT